MITRTALTRLLLVFLGVVATAALWPSDAHAACTLTYQGTAATPPPEHCSDTAPTVASVAAAGAAASVSAMLAVAGLLRAGKVAAAHALVLSTTMTSATSLSHALGATPAGGTGPPPPAAPRTRPPAQKEVKWHPPRSAGAGGIKGSFKAADSWRRWFLRHGGDAPAAHGVPHNGEFPREPLQIKRQKQLEHFFGTPEYFSRLKDLLKAGLAPQSVWSISESEARRLTYEAWHKGRPVPGKPNKREIETGRIVGSTGRGRPQTAVRAHIDQKARIHAHPADYRQGDSGE